MGFLDGFQFFEAKLQTCPFSRIAERNDKIGGLATWAQGLTPYINNKIALARYLGKPKLGELPMGVPFAYYNTNEIYDDVFSIGSAGLVGTLAPLVSSANATSKPRKFSDIVEPYTAKQPVFYYTYGKLKNAQIFNDINKLIRTYPLLGYATSDNSYYPQTTLFPTCTATNSVRFKLNGSVSFDNVADVIFVDELNKNDYGEWIFIDSFSLFDGDTFPRSEIPYVFPTMFFTANNQWSLLGWATANPAEFERKFRGDLTIGVPFNPLYSGSIDNIYRSPYSFENLSQNNTFAGIMSDVLIGQYWYNGQRAGIFESPRGGRQSPLLMSGNPDVVLVVGWGSSNAKCSYNYHWATGVETDGVHFTIDNAGAITGDGTGTTWLLPYPYLLFRSVEAFEKICTDFGLHVTNNLKDALNTPIDFFPESAESVVPDGGTPSGYNTNNSDSIPNFPDNTTDIISEIAPNVSALSSAGVYALNVAESKSLLNWLMSDDFTQNISNLFNDKLSAVGDLKIMPFDIAAHDSLHSVDSTTLTIGNVTGNIGNSRIIDGYNTWIDGGEYTYTAYYGDFNDFEKCSYSLYVPYAGIIELNAADVVNKKLKLSYAVDLATGNATAVVYSNGVVIKTAAATMGVSVPITSTNNNQRQLNNALTALTVGNGILNGSVSSIVSGNPMPVVNSITSGVYKGITNSITNPLVTQHTGSFGNGTGLSLSQTAFLIITRQIIAAPTDYKSTVGIPATYRGKISEFLGSGFVSVSADKMDIACTQSERDEILNALSRGIYL